MQDWKPIETAPKDGDYFIAFDGDDGGGVFNAVVLARWDDGQDEWEPGWVIRSVGDGDYLEGCNLTRWMPLPAPPIPSPV